MLAAANAAASAAAEAVVASLSRAYGLSPPEYGRPVDTENFVAQSPTGSGNNDDGQSQLSDKMCDMDTKWNCGNRALKGKNGWVWSKTGGHRKVCMECKKNLEWQQSGANWEDSE